MERPADHDRGRRLDGEGPPGEARGVDVLAVDVQRFAGPVRADERHRLRQALDADTGPFHGDAEAVVLGGHPAGAEAHLQAALGEEVDRGQLLGQDVGVVVVDGEDPAPDAQVRRDPCGRHHGGDRRHVDGAVTGGVGNVTGPEVVVRGEERAVAEVLRPAGDVQPLLARADREGLQPEAERSSARHAAAPALLGRGSLAQWITRGRRRPRRPPPVWRPRWPGR